MGIVFKVNLKPLDLPVKKDKYSYNISFTFVNIKPIALAEYEIRNTYQKL